MNLDAAARAHCLSIVGTASRTVLATSITPGGRHRLTLAEGYVSLLVDATAEDREAKGLRKLEGDQPPRIAVHDTLLEAANRERTLLITGPSGSGKHTSLLHLAAHLAGALIGDPAWCLDSLARPVPRNDAGTVTVERWTGAIPVPIFLDATASLEAALLLHRSVGRRILDGSLDALLLMDRAERLGDHGSVWLAEAATLASDRPRVRVLVAGDADVCSAWRVPTTFARRRIMPLFEAQRAALRALVRPGAPTAEPIDVDVRSRIGLYALALENGVVDETSFAVVDRWLADAARREALDVAGWEPDDRLGLPFLQTHIEARRLQKMAADAVGALYRADPSRWSDVVRVLARRLVAEGRPVDALVAALMEGEDETSSRGVITASRIAVDAAVDAGVHAASAAASDRLGSAARRAIRRALVPIVESGRLPLAFREEAGRFLASTGDPRDLDALVPIAAGPFTMGSTAHPNSTPPHVVTLASYRIGRYPVTNDRYLRFVEATGRGWRSSDGRLPHRASSPAVDLTWRDARAYCDWLTIRWRAEGRIASADIVRLPTEPEWERAARGLRPADGLIYPWPAAWDHDRTNAAESGLNETCTVGLFPLGRSADGCDDMAGQVWEWTTTLWGEDMSTPRFVYPYVDDGREDVAAPADVRRVLRGGCFLSPREKANCTYRGSLEPDGFWRGNGFRIVVANG